MQVLQEVTHKGTAVSATRILKRDAIGGKTGTTNDQKDAWFCGVTPEYSAVSWIGFDDMKELGDGETGTQMALPVWINLMAGVLEGVPDVAWVEPESLKLAQPIASKPTKESTPTTPESTHEQVVINAGQPNSYNVTTPRFEYKNTSALTQNQPEPAEAVYTPRRRVDNESPRAAPTRPARPQPTSEAVEIPEQIF
jgi:penicillin-binding protein 1A